MSDDSKNECTQHRHREAVKRWRLSHPDYYRRWIAKRKASQKELGWSSKEGTLKVQRIKGKLPYTINVTKQLPVHERPIRSQPSTTRKSPKTKRRKPQHETYDDFISSDDW